MMDGDDSNVISMYYVLPCAAHVLLSIA